VRASVLRDRERHIPAAEAIVSEELELFQKEWARRWAGPAIAALSAECDAIRRSVEARCFSKLNGKLTEEDKQIIAGALRLLQNKLLHAPIAAVQEEVQAGRRSLLDAVIRLFRLKT
jgi:glutamyl-tRNA reductase